MANPNKSARGSGWSPKASEERAARVAASPMVVDMGRFQRGEMSAEDFMNKWNK